MNNLPSREEFFHNLTNSKESTDDIKKYWNKDLYRCPRCNGAVKRDYSVVYNTNPPKYRYFCKDCGNVEIV